GEEPAAALPLEGGEREVEVEAAEDVAKRDPDAGVEAGGGEVHGVAAAGNARADAGGFGLAGLVRGDAARVRHSRAVDHDRVRERHVRRVAVADGVLLVEAPLDAEVTREVPARDHDPGLDLHLRRRAVELADELLRLLDVVRQVAYEQRVRAV